MVDTKQIWFEEGFKAGQKEYFENKIKPIIKLVNDGMWATARSKLKLLSSN